jgi:hypothetical protein
MTTYIAKSASNSKIKLKVSHTKNEIPNPKQRHFVEIQAAIVRLKIPNLKFQITNKSQIPNSNVRNESPFKFLLFVLVIWLLEFGACL